jgi:hypothetical protein
MKEVFGDPNAIESELLGLDGQCDKVVWILDPLVVWYAVTNFHRPGSPIF